MMKISAKWLIVLMSALAISTAGCKGEPPTPPVELQQVSKATNGMEVSVVSFTLEKPDFINSSSVAMDSQDEEFAVLRLKIKNGSNVQKKYVPAHTQAANARIQLCTDPDPDTGERVNTRAITLSSASEPNDHIHTLSQVVNDVVLEPGDEIVDEYLFEKPLTSDKRLVALVPGSLISADSKEVLRFYVGEPQQADSRTATRLGETANVGGMQVSVTSMKTEFAELTDLAHPNNKYEYPYAYTKSPVLAIRLHISNTTSQDKTYVPEHGRSKAGISLTYPDGKPLKRISLDSGVACKDQLRGTTILYGGKSYNDIYLFELPTSEIDLFFNLSGHILGVSGLYQFKLHYKPETPQSPDLKPYLKGTAEEASADDAGADSAKADDAAEAPKADEAKADAAKADAPKADDAAKK